MRNNRKTHHNTYQKLAQIKEQFRKSGDYDKYNTEYPYLLNRSNTPYLLSNYDISGSVATNIVYNVSKEAPGIAWVL